LGRPEDAPRDTFAEGSYWWRFRELLEGAKGGPDAWRFQRNQPVIRREFDRLEQNWAVRLPHVEKEALRLRAQVGEDAMRRLLTDFTDSCAREALEVLDALITDLTA
jgi:secernin